MPKYLTQTELELALEEVVAQLEYERGKKYGV